jgi:hypothetical protein
MTALRLYELINPSDKITFRATPTDAAVIAEIVAMSMLFVKDIETGDTPTIPDVWSERAVIWASAERIAAYADAFDSFLIGSPRKRAMFERAAPEGEERKAFELRRADYHTRACTSLNDICTRFWRIAAEIRAEHPAPPPAADIGANAAPAAGFF